MSERPKAGSSPPAPERGRTPLCPSAQPDMPQAVAFGVVAGTAASPRVRYLRSPLPVTPELLELTRPVDPTEVFRFAAPCAESACRHFDGSRCGLVRRLVGLPSEEDATLPVCHLRARCRWWREEGARACARCPLIVTRDHRPSDALRAAAAPAGAGPAEREDPGDDL